MDSKPSSEEGDTVNPLTQKPYSQQYYSILEKRKSLPVWDYRDQIIDTLSVNQNLIIVGETGSGKTTQIPQFLLPIRNGKKIACTQTRRVAAISIAKRVSEEMDVKLGQEVGYSIRFEDVTSKSTIIKYLTDGMLLREAVSDPLLSEYSIIILDEAHERSLNTDLLLGLLKIIHRQRSDLKTLVMSATIEHNRFQDYFSPCTTTHVSGRVFPVDIFYKPEPEPNYLDSAIQTAVQLHLYEPPGDILIFLTGEEEIEQAVRRINEEVEAVQPKAMGCLVLPIYSALAPARQQKIFDSFPEGRKIICATNIAETSLTIDGIVFVIDTGFSKQKVYNPRNRVEGLQVSPISQASAQQRAGRAGRTRPGKVYRLYTEDSFAKLAPATYPEILRSNLASVVLHMFRLGIKDIDIVHFHWMDPPVPETMMRALEELNHLGAIDNDRNLTRLGSLMSEFPIEPHLAKMLLISNELGCVEDMLSIVAMLSVAPCHMRPRDCLRQADAAKARFHHPSGDHFALLNVYNAYVKNKDRVEWFRHNFLNYKTLQGAENVRQQLRGILQRQNLPSGPSPVDRETALLRSLASGYFLKAAFFQKNQGWRTVIDHFRVDLHPSSCVRGKCQWIIFSEFVHTSKEFVRVCTEMPPEMLVKASLQYYTPEKFPAGVIRQTVQDIIASVPQPLPPKASRRGRVSSKKQNG